MCHSVYPTDMRIWIKTLGTTTPGESGFANDLWYPLGEVFNLNFGCFWQQNFVTLLPWLFSSHSVACTFRRSVWHDWNFWKENESRLFFSYPTQYILTCVATFSNVTLTQETKCTCVQKWPVQHLLSTSWLEMFTKHLILCFSWGLSKTQKLTFGFCDQRLYCEKREERIVPPWLRYPLKTVARWWQWLPARAKGRTGQPKCHTLIPRSVKSQTLGCPLTFLPLLTERWAKWYLDPTEPSS